MKQRKVSLEPDLAAWVDAEATRRRTSASQVMREAIAAYADALKAAQKTSEPKARSR